MAELAPKKVRTSQIREDLLAGLTRWKKDDIGFGSIEKKYSLTMTEMCDLLAHPKIKNIETKIPTFIIEDDIEDEPILNESSSQVDEVVSSRLPEREATVEVAPRQTTIVVKAKKEEPQVVYESFI
jgi:hypothetical protein